MANSGAILAVSFELGGPLGPIGVPRRSAFLTLRPARAHARSRKARTALGQRAAHPESRRKSAAAASAAATGPQHAHARRTEPHAHRASLPRAAASSSAAGARHHALTTTNDDEKMLRAAPGFDGAFVDGTVNPAPDIARETKPADVRSAAHTTWKPLLTSAAWREKLGRLNAISRARRRTPCRRLR